MTDAKIAALESTVATLQVNLTSLINAAVADTKELKGSVDTFYLLYSGALVFFMQAGFGVLEAGSVRVKNTRNILLKNLLDACVGAFIWWAWGYGTAYHKADGDGNPFIGLPGKAHGSVGWVLGDESASGADFVSWWFQYVFAATGATIVSGAMAERAQLGAYVIYTTVITGLIYPVVVHWVWDGVGWASSFNPDAVLGGAIDFAGSGVVHMTGGIAAFWGALIIGPRAGRFDLDGTPVAIRGHSSVLQALGTFILWMGWYGFNPGSTLAITPKGYAATAARATICTTLSAAFAGMTVVLITKRLDHIWDLGALSNGILAGLVSITAGCATVLPWHAMLIGIIGGLVYIGGSRLELKLKIDDPLDAFAVHGCCGFWACIATALFSVPDYAWGAGGGLFYGEGKHLGIVLLLALAQIAWVSVLAGGMFMGMKMAGVLRISEDVETLGMDLSKHGGSAYEYGGGPEGFDASKHNSSTSTGKYKVAPLPDEGTNRTNESNSVHSIGGSANPNVTITDSD